MNWNRRQFITQGSLLALASCSKVPKEQNISNNPTNNQALLKDIFSGCFKIGCIVTAKQLETNDTQSLALLGNEFNALTMENAMKWEHLQPHSGYYQWLPVNQFLALCERQNQSAVGHVLVWHSQTPHWVYTSKNGNPRSPESLQKLMVQHVQHSVDHCKGKIWAWDVVNEAFEDDGSWRRSFWQQQLGENYIADAFARAHEADTDALLLYNDYNMHLPSKRKSVLSLIEQLRGKGIPIHGIGMQGHIGLDYPELDEFEQSILAFNRAGLEVHISELDIDVLPNPYLGADVSTRLEYSKEKDPYIDSLPGAIAKLQADRAETLFKILLKHKEGIARVSFWGLSDKDSWKNDFPIPGRTNYPLLFDRQLQEKPVLQRLKSLQVSNLS